MVISALYLAASAFGILRVPGVELTYANLALILLGIASMWVGRFDDPLPFLYLLNTMAVDLLFRAMQARMGDVGYSVNIGKMALFALVAQQLSATGSRGRNLLTLLFGIAAVCSEIFALAYPEFREELYYAPGAAVNIDGVDEVAGLFYRPTGLIGDPNYFAIPLVLMAAGLFARRRYGWFCSGVLVVALTGSRAAMVALFLPIAIQQLFNVRTRPLRLITYVVCFLGVFVVASYFNEILRGDTADSNAERAMLLRQGIDNLATLSFLRATYGQPLGSGISGEALVVHNTYLQTAVTSALLAAFLIYRSIAGLIRSPDRLALAALIIEMLFLDVSSFSSILFIFFVLSEGSRRWSPLLDAAPVASPQGTRRDRNLLGRAVREQPPRRATDP